MNLELATIAKIAEAFSAEGYTISDDNDENQPADSTEKRKEGDKYSRFIIKLYGLTMKAHVLPWLAAGIFILGSLSDLFLKTSYITDHVIVGIGSVLWLLYAYSKQNYPVLLQNLIVGGISVYIFLRHLSIGKFAYLIAALLCMSCAVNRHQNVMSANPTTAPGICLNTSNAASTYMIRMRSNSHPPICELEVIGKALDEKIKVIGELQQFVDEVGESSGTGKLVDHDEYDDIYNGARALINSVLKDVRKIKRAC